MWLCIAGNVAKPEAVDVDMIENSAVKPSKDAGELIEPCSDVSPADDAQTCAGARDEPAGRQSSVDKPAASAAYATDGDSGLAWSDTKRAQALP